MCKEGLDMPSIGLIVCQVMKAVCKIQLIMCLLLLAMCKI